MHVMLPHVATGRTVRPDPWVGPPTREARVPTWMSPPLVPAALLRLSNRLRK